MKKQPYEIVYDDHILTTNSETVALKCLSTGAIGLNYYDNRPIPLPHNMEGIYDHIKFGRLYWDDMKSEEFFTDSQRLYLEEIFTPKEVDFETALSSLIPKVIYGERIYPRFDEVIELGFYDDSCRMRHSVNFSAEITKGIRSVFDVTEFFKNDHFSATINRSGITWKAVWKSKFKGQFTPDAKIKGINNSDYGFTLYKDEGDGKFKNILHYDLYNVQKLPPFEIGYCLGIVLETLYNGYLEHIYEQYPHDDKKDRIMITNRIWLKRDEKRTGIPITGYIRDKPPAVIRF